jgi:hypothetical protein
MCHTVAKSAVPQVRHSDLSKKDEHELISEAEYIYLTGIPSKQNTLAQYAFYMYNSRYLTCPPVPPELKQVPAWKHVEDLQAMIERLQAISEELEYRKI